LRRRETNMEYRVLGKDGIEVSVVTFGAWAIGGWLWGGTDQKEAVAAIQKGIELGITSIDTAPAYGFGLSEKIVGEAIRGKRDKLQILTKFGLRWDLKKGEFYFNTEDAQGRPVQMYKHSGAKSVMEECERSLELFGTDYIDLYQIHWPDSTTPIDETMETVGRLIEQGKVRAAGVCNYSVEQMKEARRTVRLLSNQVPYSMVNRDIENDVVPFCVEHGFGILAYSPLQRGLLTGKIKPGHAFGPGDHRPTTPFFKEKNMSKVLSFLDDLRPIAEGHGATLAQVVINWTIRRRGITAALVGARNPKQVEENAKAASIPLSESDIEAIDRRLEGLRLDL
jgi:aryl-alcohol dehydrogenase-like predicted oxidoreductase